MKYKKLSRRNAIGNIGAIALASQFPYSTFIPKVSAASHIEPELHYLSITEISEWIRSKKISIRELTQVMLKRIADTDIKLKSYVTVMEEEALSTASALDQEFANGKYRGPLHGVPIGIKDLLYTRGVPTLAGSMVHSNFIPDYDATVVTKLREAGAIILGKLALCEGAFSPYHPDFQVPVNPWDATRWSGVSSSGCGVATAAGLCFASIGTDTGGSIRYPSAANGCVGLKPTYGRVSRYGVFGLADSMDHVGPMTRCVEDAAIMFEAIAGFDPYDPTSLDTEARHMKEHLSMGVRGLRIGYDREYSSLDVDPEVAKALDEVLKELNRQGAEIVDVKMPDISEINNAWYHLCIVEAVLANAMSFPERAEYYGPGFRAELENGYQVSGIEYAKACRVRADFTGLLKRMLSTVDCMLCPGMSHTARPKLEDPYMYETEQMWSSVVPNDVFTKAFNFSGSPCLSVIAGFSSEGLPISAQFVGSDLSEAMLCRIAYAYERSTGWHKRHPQP